VRVVVAHCASLGAGRDLDRGDGGPLVSNFELFARLMDDGAYAGRLFGDIAAIPQANRIDVVDRLLARPHWHSRLVNGSDYPLPGILPLVAMETFVERGLLDPGAVAVLRELRDHNALLFDFVLKRSLRRNGARFADATFETRSFFTAR
jgi:uncharacterized protein